MRSSAKTRTSRSPRRKSAVSRRASSKAIVKRVAENLYPRAKAEPPSLAEAIEKVLIGGDLTPLTVEQRLSYYKQVCQSLGLNPLTHPFAYIAFREGESGPAKLVLYALKDCTEQLRKIHGISVVSMNRTIEDEVCTVDVQVRDKTGRQDSGVGVVSLSKYKDGQYRNLSGRERDNAIMKADTKAKRRATLSICGLGILDESELEFIGDYGTVTPEGRVMFKEPERDPELWCKKHKCHIKNCPSDEHTSKENEEMDARLQREKLTPEQKAVVDQKVATAKQTGATTPAISGAKATAAPQESSGPKPKEPGATAPATARTATTSSRESNSGTGVPKAEIPSELYSVKGEVEMIFSKGKDNEPLKTSRGSHFRKVVVKGLMYYVFDNKEKPVDGNNKMTVFQMLDAAKPGDPIEFLGQTTETDKGTMRNLMVLQRINDYEWDEHGVPVLRYQKEFFSREPGE